MSSIPRAAITHPSRSTVFCPRVFHDSRRQGRRHGRDFEPEGRPLQDGFGGHESCKIQRDQPRRHYRRRHHYGRSDRGPESRSLYRHAVRRRFAESRNGRENGQRLHCREKELEPDQPEGTINIDAIFSPIKKVNYVVSHARVGQITDYDKLVLEVWTDGSLNPGDAIAY